MITVFLLEHSYEVGKFEEMKIIGIYSTKMHAEAVIEIYKKLPGFKDYPDSFNIDEYKINKDNWTEGFGSTDTKNMTTLRIYFYLYATCKTIETEMQST